VAGIAHNPSRLVGRVEAVGYCSFVFQVHFSPGFLRTPTGHGGADTHSKFQPTDRSRSVRITQSSLASPPGPSDPSYSCSDPPSHSRLSESVNDLLQHTFRKFRAKWSTESSRIDQLRSWLAGTGAFWASSSFSLHFFSLSFTYIDGG